MSRRWMTAVATALLVISSAAPAATAAEPAPVVDSAPQPDSQQTPSSPADFTGPEAPAGAPAPDVADPAAFPDADAEVPAEADPAAEPDLFADLPADHWVYPEVERLVAAGVIHGDPAGRFRANAPISRAEFLKMLLTARRLDPAGKCEGLFADAPCWTWYAPWVELAYRLAIIDPKTDMLDDEPDYFDPEGAITRQEVVAALVRATGKRWTAQTMHWREASEILGRYADGADVMEPYRKPMALALSQGLVQGFGDGTLRPWHPVTRAEAAALVGRVLLDATDLPTVSLDGHEVVYVDALDMRTTMYTAGESGVGTRTATGVTVRPGAVAVDPAVIPLGTLLFVEGYGYAVAVDTGGAVRGNAIDLFDWVSHREALLFGIQTRRVWVLP